MGSASTAIAARRMNSRTGEGGREKGAEPSTWIRPGALLGVPPERLCAACPRSPMFLARDSVEASRRAQQKREHRAGPARSPASVAA
jgi:hypothetical protein